MPAANQPIVTQRQMPMPPQSVLPPEGTAPVVDQDAANTAADASPTTKVLAYLQSRGYQPSSENVRRALEANAREPGTIPGLISGTASTDAEDQAAMAAARGGSGGSRSGVGGLPTPPIPPTGARPTGPTVPPAPTTTDGSDGNLGSKILLGAGLPLAAAGAGYLGSKIPPMPDVAAGVPNAAQGGVDVPPQLTGPEAPKLLTGPASGAGATTPSDMDIAMAKAIAPASSPSFVQGVPPVTAAAQNITPRGPVTPDPAVVNESNIASGKTSAPPVPFNSQSPRTAPAVPTTTPSPTVDIPQVTVHAPRIATPRVATPRVRIPL